jgi:phosphoribosylglycinamide formyltransferase-1
LPEEADHTIRRHLHEQQIQLLFEEHKIELILLSGYMRLVSAEFVDRWTQRIINIHPSLLPAFPGAHAHRDVLAAGVEVSGCTVHYVDAGIDSGVILGQRRVPVFSDDDESSLAERVKTEEHQLYPEVIDRIVL